MNFTGRKQGRNEKKSKAYFELKRQKKNDISRIHRALEIVVQCLSCSLLVFWVWSTWLKWKLVVSLTTILLTFKNSQQKMDAFMVTFSIPSTYNICVIFCWLGDGKMSRSTLWESYRCHQWTYPIFGYRIEFPRAPTSNVSGNDPLA